MLLNYKFRKVIAGFIPAVTILAVSFIANPVSTHAADFVHHHSESCLGSVAKTCTDHTITSEEVGPIMVMCRDCQLFTSAHRMVYTEVCNKGLIEPRVSEQQTCTWCGKELFQYPITKPTAHVYYETENICGYSEGEVLGSVSLLKSTSDWTNQDVTISASVSSLAANFDSSSVTYDFGNGASGSSTYTVSSNGTYSVTVNSPLYGSISDSIVVNNIDKNAPTIAISKNTNRWTEAGVDVYVSASDAESGLSDTAYSFNGGAYGSSSSMHISSNGTVYVKVIDKAGNVATGSIVVNNIGKDPAVIEAERKEAERLEAERKEAERLEAIKKAEEEKKKQELLNAVNKKEETSKPSQAENVTTNKPGSNSTNSVAGSGSTNVTANPETESTTHKNPLGNFIASFTGISKNDSQEEKDIIENESTPAKNLVSVSKKPNSRTNDTSKENVSSDSSVSNYSKLEENSKQGNVSVSTKKTEDNTIATVETKADEEKDNTDISIVEKSDSSVYAYIVAGVMVLLLGLMLVSHFNYVYYRKDGKIKVVSAARAKTDGKKIIVMINDKKLTDGGKYFIYLSPWMKLSRKKKHVYVQIKNQDVLIVTDEGLCFSY